MMVLGNTNGLSLLLPNTQEVVRRHTSFALPEESQGGGGWEVGGWREEQFLQGFVVGLSGQ